MNKPTENTLKQLRLPSPSDDYYQFRTPAAAKNGNRRLLVPALAAALVLSLAVNVLQWTNPQPGELSLDKKTLAQHAVQSRGPEMRSGVSLPGGGSNYIELIPGG